MQEVVDSVQASYDTWAMTHAWFYGAKCILPKTSETIGVLDRTLRKNAGLEVGLPEETEGRRRGPRSGNMFGTTSRVPQREIDRIQSERKDSRSLTWIIGTSLLFEAVLLGICCWLFSRRDF